MRHPEINVLGLGSFGSLIAAMACSAWEQTLTSWTTYDSITADTLGRTIHYGGVNLEHPTLQDHKDSLLNFDICKIGKTGRGAETPAEAEEALALELARHGSTLMQRIKAVDFNFFIATLGGNSGSELLPSLTQLSLDNQKVTIPIFIVPDRKDGTQPRNLVRANAIRKKIYEMGIPYFEMPIAAVYQRGAVDIQAQLAEFDRQAGFIASTFVLALAKFGYAIDGARFRPLIRGSRRLVFHRSSIPFRQLANRDKVREFYTETWGNTFFEEREKETVDAVVRVFQTLNHGRHIGQINDAFGEMDEHSAEKNPDNFPNIYSVHAAGHQQDTMTVTTIRFLKADPAFTTNRYYDFFDADESQVSNVIVIPQLSKERYKAMKVFATLGDWIEAVKAGNSAALEAEPIEPIYHYQTIMANLKALAEIGDNGKGLPQSWHNRGKALVQKNLKLTKFEVRDDSGKLWWLSAELNLEQMQTILSWRSLTEESFAEMQKRYYLAATFGESFLLTLEIVDDPKAVAAAANSAGKSNPPKAASPVRDFFGKVFSETKSDMQKLNLK